MDDFVPVIDLSTLDDPRVVARACETSGFFTVVGHGVPRELVDRMYTVTNAFFTLPEEEKERSANRGEGVSGLRRFGGDGSTPPGLYEAFAVHVTGDLSDAERARLGGYPATWKAANIWPDRPADFEKTWHEYLTAMTRLSRDIMRWFALALEVEEDFFDRRFDEHVSLMLANFYYPQHEPPPPGQIRREAHSDWGALTVLYQEDDLGGLQVREGEDTWHDIPAIPDSFVVNIGDLMAFWTGGRWASTVHRVVNPERGNTSSRISVPFFYLPNHDASIEPMTGGGAEGVTVGEWFARKMKETFAAASRES